jgi:CheY-like chemotaxis protein
MKDKILVVDDDKQVRGYLSRVLSEVGGFSVDVAVVPVCQLHCGVQARVPMG